MHTFRNAHGTPWDLTIDIAAAKRVRSLVGVDLVRLVDGGCKPLAELLGDLILLVDVLYVLCREQCEKREISDEEFGMAMSGDCLEEAAKAFVEELIDFFPDAKRRDLLRRAIGLGEKAGAKAMAIAEQKLQEVEKKILGGSSGNLQAQSASTQEH